MYKELTTPDCGSRGNIEWCDGAMAAVLACVLAANFVAAYGTWSSHRSEVRCVCRAVWQ